MLMLVSTYLGAKFLVRIVRMMLSVKVYVGAIITDLHFQQFRVQSQAPCIEAREPAQTISQGNASVQCVPVC
jgi:hypothetical protein